MRKLILVIFFFYSLQIKSQTQATFTPLQTTNAVISYPYSNVNSAPNSLDLVAAYWTGNATEGAWRSFFKVDLSSISPNATIDSAFFSFYANPNSTFGNVGNPNFGTQNAAYICRVTSAWNSNQFNWNNQPSFTTINAAEINQSANTVEDYLHVDATALIKDIILGTNNGFAFVLQHEMNYYNSQIFHSSSSPDENKRPKLTVYYRFPESVSDYILDENEFNYTSINNNLNIEFNNDFSGSISIYNMMGMKVLEERINTQKNISFNTCQYCAGIYFVELKGEKSRKVIKVKI
jgi:hypothetical protein